MYKLITSTVVFAVLAGFAGIVEAANKLQLQAPALGTSMEWKCTGPYSKRYRLKVTSIRNNVVTYKGTLDGKPYFVKKNAMFTGTSLWNRLIGRRRQWVDMEAFKDFWLLRPGSLFNGTVPASKGETKWVWKHELSVGQARTINHPILGRIKIVPVSERRSVVHGKYWSTMTTYLLPYKGISVRWAYRDHKGIENCNLSRLSPRN